LARNARGRTAAGKRALRFVLPLLGLLIAWAVFYAEGRLLLTIPVDVHDGAAWESK
jgi:hypothetical protein